MFRVRVHCKRTRGASGQSPLRPQPARKFVQSGIINQMNVFKSSFRRMLAPFAVLVLAGVTVPAGTALAFTCSSNADCSDRGSRRDGHACQDEDRKGREHPAKRAFEDVHLVNDPRLHELSRWLWTERRLARRSPRPLTVNPHPEHMGLSGF